MQSLPLVVRPGTWRLFSQRREDPRFDDVKAEVLARDQNTCQFCGFQASLYQEVINLDGDYRNNQLDNLATACCFCTQCLFLEVVGNGYGGGRLIYMPEITQPQLNSFCHVIFCAMTNATDYRDSAQSMYRSLKFRSRPVEEKFGENSEKPGVFCQMLLEQDDDVEKLSADILKDLRLLPAYPKFKSQLEDWAKSAAEELEQDGRG